MDESAVAEKLGKGWLQCRMIIEILGTPSKHLEDTLQLVLKRFRDEKGVDVLSEQVHPPKKQDELFSTFAEVEVLFKDFVALTRICFDYMPSSVEIFKPESLKLPAVEISNFVNDMMSSLHRVDLNLKSVNAANQLLERNSANLLKNFLLLILDSSRKSTGDISKAVGIKPEQLEPFMKAFTQEGLIRKSGEFWEKV